LPSTQIRDSPETGPGRRPRPLVCSSRDDLRALRAAVAARAVAAGLPARRADDLVLAAHEIAANAHLHGGGSATLRTWTDAGEFLCEVADHGCGMSDPEAGTTPPAPTQIGGRGLWLARQLCDRVQVSTGASGTVVLLHLTL
jgi:anti-sigma regulatory factor (Ser/Thr protein kinase)